MGNCYQRKIKSERKSNKNSKKSITSCNDEEKTVEELFNFNFEDMPEWEGNI